MTDLDLVIENTQDVIDLEFENQPRQIDLEIQSSGDYDMLANHPSINEEELIGNKTFDDLGDHTLSNIEIKDIFDRVFRR